jgi:hypothetical protein
MSSDLGVEQSKELVAVLHQLVPHLPNSAEYGGLVKDAANRAGGLLARGGVSWSQTNQLLHLCSLAGMSEGFFRYYFLESPSLHPYPLSKVGTSSYAPPLGVPQIGSAEQLSWGLRRFIQDALLYWGNLRQAYRDLRSLTSEEIHERFQARRFDQKRLIERGPVIQPLPIPHDHRYLISEMACKTYPNQGKLEDATQVQWALRAFDELSGDQRPVAPDKLKERAKQLADGNKQLPLFELMYEDPSGTLATRDDVLTLYRDQWNNFSAARARALENTRTYLSLCNDLDVYVATSMRTREDFRDMARTCESIFCDPRLAKFNIRYFDPTMSAAESHEDKGIIECLMVKTAKVILYFAQHKESLGKVSEYAMGLTLGKPVIILCPPDGKGAELYELYRTAHPLTRLVEFKTGLVNGALVTRKPSDVVTLLDRLFTNMMEFDLEIKPGSNGYYLLNERLTGTAYRVITDDRLLTETFWNNWHGVW